MRPVTPTPVSYVQRFCTDAQISSLFGEEVPSAVVMAREMIKHGQSIEIAIDN